MRFYYLSNLQKIDISITALMFCIFIGFIRTIILNQDLNSKEIITMTLLFFAWYGCTLLMANAFTSENQYNKLTNL
jgi:hypothetical protein